MCRDGEDGVSEESGGKTEQIHRDRHEPPVKCAWDVLGLQGAVGLKEI